MKNILFLFLCSIHLLFAQNLPLDSLKKARNYAKIELPDSLGFRLVSLLEGYDIFSLEGKKINAEIYEELTEVGYGYFNAVNMQGQQYLLDRNGKILFSHKYDEIKAWREGIFEVEIEGEQILINAENKVMVNPEYNDDIYPLYNANAFPSTDYKTLFSEDYAFYPCDSFIVVVEDSFILYNSQNEQLLKFSFDTDFLENFRARRSCIRNTPFEEQIFLVQKDKIILQNNYLTQGTLWVEWTIDADINKRDFPRFYIENKDHNTHFYQFSGKEEISKKQAIYHSIIDETGSKVLEGNWNFAHNRICEFIDGYLILQKELVGVPDTSYKDKMTENPNNPLLLESCKNEQKKEAHWQSVCVLVRLSDKKEILQMGTFYPNYRATNIRGLNFFGKDKCFAVLNERIGITDLTGKWLIPPIYENVEWVENATACLVLGDSLLIINTDLLSKKIERGVAEVERGNSIFYTNKAIKSDNQAGNLQKKWYEVTVWKEFKPIHTAVAEYNEESYYGIGNEICISPNIFWKTNNKGEKEGIVILLENGKVQPYPITNEDDIDFNTYPYHFLLKIKKWGVIDRYGKQIIDFAYERVIFCGNYYACYKGNNIEYRDKKGNLLFTKPLIPAYQNLLKNAKIGNFWQQKGYEIPIFAATKIPEQNYLEEDDFIPNLYFEKGKAYYGENKIYELRKFPLYGYINEKGQEVIPPIYTEIVKSNPTTLILVTPSSCEKINLLTQEKQRLPFENVKVQASYKAAKKDGLWAFINDDFVPTSDFIYKDIIKWVNQEHINVWDKDSKEGKLSDKDHKMLIPMRYKEIRRDNYDHPHIWRGNYSEGKKIDVYSNNFVFLGTYEEVGSASTQYFIAQKKGKWGVVNYKRENIVPFIYESKKSISLLSDGIAAKTPTELHLYSHLGKKIWIANKNAYMEEWKGWYCVQDPKSSPKESVVTILNAKGEVKLSYKGSLTVPETFKNPNFVIAKFSETGKMNLLDSNLQKVFAKDYSDIKLGYETFIVYQDGKAGILDNRAKFLLSPQNSIHTHIEEFGNWKRIFRTNIEGKDLYIRPNGAFLFPQGYDFYKIQSSNCCTVSKNGKAGCIDSLGNVLVPLEWENVSLYEQNENLYLARQECDYYLLDKNGRKILADAYEAFYLLKFNMKDKIVMEKAHKKGLLDENGKLLLDCKYDNIQAIAEDTATKMRYIVFSLNEKSGIITQEGKEILPPIYKITERYLNFPIIEKDSLFGFFNPKTAKLSAMYPKIQKCDVDFADGNQYYIVTLNDGKMQIIDENEKNVLAKTYENIWFGECLVRQESRRAFAVPAFWMKDAEKKYCYYFQYGKWHLEQRED